jgi:hypothetical protein
MLLACCDPAPLRRQGKESVKPAPGLDGDRSNLRQMAAWITGWAREVPLSPRRGMGPTRRRQSRLAQGALTSTSRDSSPRVEATVLIRPGQDRLLK